MSNMAGAAEAAEAVTGVDAVSYDRVKSLLINPLKPSGNYMYKLL
jgi:hypothetical protein